ncbi:MAG: hypothetical protein EXS08_01045 [Planctomycetes bacterium]|nr:hypothetical protein [Planctomycetota bacterium]
MSALRAWLAALVLLAPAAAQNLDAPAQLGQEEARASLDKALAWLLEKQNPDGSWGTGAMDGLLELGFSIESFYSWQVASNSIACLAMLGAPESAARTAVLERGIHWLEETRVPQRGSDWDIDYVWGGLFGFAAAIELASDPHFRTPEWAPRLEALAKRYFAILEANQVPTGGWGYYDDPIFSRRPKWATSFSTATVLPALKRAEELGWVSDPKIRARATEFVSQCSLPNGAYAYDLSPIPWVGGDSINNVKGSLGRIQACNWALYSVGEKKVSVERLRAGLEAFFEHHRFLDVAFMDPVPHEAYYFNSGYFYLFAHYYAARVINLLPADERELWHARLRPHLVKVMRKDGASTDFLTSSYMKVAGTAFSALALEFGLPREIEKRPR